MSSPFSTFTHLSSPKAEDYRSVLTVFSQARSEFVLHLRPAEIAHQLDRPEADIELLLDSLSQWGNLDRHHDHVEATSITEFYRVKWLYQLSPRGEATELALQTYHESLQQPGELQSEALRDIIDYLEALKRLLIANPETATADFSKILRQFNHLNDRFEEFTVQAQRFMQFLQSTIELHGLSLEDFIAYKDKLIDYLERFVSDLITSTNEIEQHITGLETLAVRRYFPGVAREAMIDALDPNDSQRRQQEEQRREGRWEGLRRWFLGQDGQPSQADTLRARTREAIPSLLIAMQNFHDQRETGADRRRDWMQLATWFAEMPTDDMAHRLWRVAFALAPARHLRINEETLDHRDQSSEPPRTSWLKAEPMWLEPQLRKSGSTHRPGAAKAIVDLSTEREALRRLAEEENAQIASAHSRLTMTRPMHLSDFAPLEATPFQLLLDLLGRAVADSAGLPLERFPVQASSTDGALLISLWPPSDDSFAELSTTEGVLRSPNYRVQISGSSLSRAS
jgi:uncharacterized protein (TIGR02677 family)